MNKRIQLILITIIAVAVLAVAARLLFISFSQKEKIYTPRQTVISAESRESKALKQVKELLDSGKRAEAIKSLEEISDSARGQRDGYEAVLMLADIYNKDRNFLKAKALYNEIINDYSQFCNYADMQKKIASVNIALLFSNIISPGSEIYTVVPGDSLSRIAGRYKTTIELIKQANNLNSDVIIPGMKLKVQNKPFHIIVDNKQCTLTVLSGDDVIKTYDVATGKNNATPIGTFQVTDRLVDPVWYNKGLAVPADSPENVLGTRWMGLNTPEPGYGIHGTTEPESIGYQSTEGCVRMRNKDVEELYSIIPSGTTVVVID
jgi:lipoprotein-anchoring transpeptidase ErfK/SrfK